MSSLESQLQQKLTAQATPKEPETETQKDPKPKETNAPKGSGNDESEFFDDEPGDGSDGEDQSEDEFITTPSGKKATRMHVVYVYMPTAL